MTATDCARGALRAGFQGQDADRIVAIALAESGGRADALNNSTYPNLPEYHELTEDELARGWVPEYSVGPLQINLNVWGQPEGNVWGQLGGEALEGRITEEQASDYDACFAFAHDVIVPQQGYEAWSTFNAGRHTEHMTAAHEAVDAVMREEAVPIAELPPLAVYIVEPGDTLWTLAERWLGDGTRWQVINIVSGRRADQDLIQVGEVLRVPTPATEVQPYPPIQPEAPGDVGQGPQNTVDPFASERERLVSRIVDATVRTQTHLNEATNLVAELLQISRDAVSLTERQDARERGE